MLAATAALTVPRVLRTQEAAKFGTVRIGMQTILSGPVKLVGTSQQNAAQIELERTNACDMALRADGHHGLYLDLAQQTIGGLLVTPALDVDVQHDPAPVHRTPESMLLAPNRDHDFIKVPLVSRRGQPTTDLVDEALSKRQRSLPHRLVADHDAAGDKNLVDIAQAEREEEVEPDRMTSDAGPPSSGTRGAAAAGIARLGGLSSSAETFAYAANSAASYSTQACC